MKKEEHKEIDFILYLFSKTRFSRNELARHVMVTIFLVIDTCNSNYLLSDLVCFHKMGHILTLRMPHATSARNNVLMYHHTESHTTSATVALRRT